MPVVEEQSELRVPVRDEAGDGHAGQGVPRGADGVLPGHELQLVAGDDGVDLLGGELEREHRSALVLTVELEERSVADVAASLHGLGVGQLVGLLDRLADAGCQLGGVVLVDEAAGQLVVVVVSDQVEAVGLQHHDPEPRGGRPVTAVGEVLVVPRLSGPADDERAAAVVLVEQPLVPGLARNHADLELAELAVHHDVVTVVLVGPAGGVGRGVVIEHGLNEQTVCHCCLHGKELPRRGLALEFPAHH